eukprot:42691_1
MASTNMKKPKIKHPKKEGYLDKQSAFWKTYRKRWMVLQGHTLYSFKEEKVYDNPTEVFDLRIFNTAKKSTDGKTGQFEVSSPDDSRTFVASSNNEMKDWIKHIKAASKSKKKSSSIANIAKKRPSANIRSTHTASSKTNKRKTTKKSAKPHNSHSNQNKSHPKRNAKSTKKSKNTSKPKKPKALTVTNNSMNKHIQRMQRKQHVKSHSHDTSPIPAKKKKAPPKKKHKLNANHHQSRASVPNIVSQQRGRPKTKQPPPAEHMTVGRKERPRSKSRSGSSLNVKVDPNHRKSLSSMFGFRSRSRSKSKTHATVEDSKTELTDDEALPHSLYNASYEFSKQAAQSMQRSQTDRGPRTRANHKQVASFDAPHTPTPTGNFYVITFDRKPFGLTLNAYDEDTQIGAIVMVNHNVNDQVIHQFSRFISINGDPCKNYSFERIKGMCRNAPLPTTIKFHDKDGIVPQPVTLTASISAGNEVRISTKPSNQRLKASDNFSKKQNKHHSPRFADRDEAKTKDKTPDSIVEKPKEVKPKKKKASKATKPKESTKAKQNREKKAAKQLMQSLGGMTDIQSAEKYERQRKWKECIESYEKGIEELEKSVKGLERSGFLSEYQQKQCQQQIDAYCRKLIKLQRDHNKEILKSAQHSLQKKNHNRAHTALGKKKSKTITSYNAGGSLALTTKSKQSSYEHDTVDEADEQAVFGKKQSDTTAVVPKKTINKENIDDTNTTAPPKEDDEPIDDMYSFLDRSEATKNHKTKMSKATKKKTKKSKPNKDDKKENKKKKKKKKKGGDSDEDDKKEDDKDKKKSKLSKQDAEFRSRLEADIISEAPDVCFKDVQGLANVKLALYETIILPALRPELFTGLREPTAGLLLFGPPGNGKTMIAKCVAAGCQSTFFSISASSITSKFVGDAERIMRTLFALAREKAPSIIFIDEIDSMLTARGGNNEAESSRRVKTEFLIQFDGVKKKSDQKKRILVIGATNLPDQLDEAVLRRFGKRIMVPLPDSETRQGVLRLLMSKQKTDLSATDYEQIVAKCDGYSCSDLSTLCKDAAMGPIRSLGVRILELKNQADMPAIERKHFEGSLNNVRPSLTDQSLKYFEDWNDKFGSKIHLSMSALPDDMRPYTMEELAEIDRKREEKELAEKAAMEAAEKEDESDEEEED